jgi:hypothetical protein
MAELPKDKPEVCPAFLFSYEKGNATRAYFIDPVYKKDA